MPNRYPRKRFNSCFGLRGFSCSDNNRLGNPLSRTLRFEPLEDRRLLSVDLVTKAAISPVTAWGNSSISPNALSADGRYTVFSSDASNLVSGVAIASGVQNIYRFDRVTGEVLLVSVNAAGTASGNGASINPVISADGSVVAFQSDANNLHPLDTNSDKADVFARNLATNTTHLVSIDAAGTGSGNRASINPAISADGNLVAFLSSSSNLHTLDTSLLSDFFARNLATGTTYLVSVDSTGTGGGNSNVPTYSKPVINSDGTVVAFQSTASNLHVLDNDSGLDIFARNLATGTTHLVSVNKTGTESGKGFSYNPVISADGNVIAFESLASNLHGLYSTRRDIFARNLATDTTYLVSVDVTGTTGGNSDSLNPVISADGNVVAFESDASNLHALATPSRSGIFARNLTTGMTHLVSVNVSGTGGGDYDSTNPVISADGNIVAFQSSAKNVHVLDANSSIENDIFARNLTTGTTYLVSVDATATSGGHSDSITPVISADGNVVAFKSGASNLINRDYNVSADVFVRDIGNGGTQAASRRHPEMPSSSTAGGSSTTNPNAVSADGRYVAFSSTASNLVSGIEVASGLRNIYRFDRLTNEMLLVSVNIAGTGGGDSDSTNPVISADGNVVAYESDARNLLPLEKNNIYSDVFARNLATGTTYLVSVNTTGTGGGDRHSTDPVISADGNIVAFESDARNLHALDNNNRPDIFARNLATGTTHLVSINPAGTGSDNRSSTKPAISADGNVVAFVSKDVFARNLMMGTTLLVSVDVTGAGGGNGNSFDPVISADGNVVAFASVAENLHHLDNNNLQDIFARNLTTGTTYLISLDSTGTGSGNKNSYNPAISANGNVVAFESPATNLHALDTNSSSNSDVFARNLATGTTHLVSINAAGTGSGRRSSFNPVLSADGNMVAFESGADLHPWDISGAEVDVFVRHLATGITYFVSAPLTNMGGSGDSTDPAISADGNVVTFQTTATDLVQGDGNGEIDVFFATLVVASPPGNPGDFNRDGIVDAVDYILWRNMLGTTGLPVYSGADGDGNGAIGQGDYNVWRAHFGQTTANASALSVTNSDGIQLNAISDTIPSDDADLTIADSMSANMVVLTNSGAKLEAPAESDTRSDVAKFVRNWDSIAEWKSIDASGKFANHFSGQDIASSRLLRENALAAWMESRSIERRNSLLDFDTYFGEGSDANSNDDNCQCVDLAMEGLHQVVAAEVRTNALVCD